MSGGAAMPYLHPAQSWRQWLAVGFAAVAAAPTMSLEVSGRPMGAVAVVQAAPWRIRHGTGRRFAARIAPRDAWRSGFWLRRAAMTAIAGTSLGFQRSAAGRRRQITARRRTQLAAQAEDSLLSIIQNHGDNSPDSMARVKRAVLALNAPLKKSALKDFIGDWRCEWNSNTAGGGRNTMLKFVSFQVLPPVMVSFFRSYVRVTASSYEIVSAFTIAGYESSDAAMCIKGKRVKSTGSVLKFKPEQIRIVESDSVTSLSQDMIDSTFLTRYKKWQPIKSADAKFVEIEYISDSMAMFMTETGVTWVCSRLSGGISDCIPFKM